MDQLKTISVDEENLGEIIIRIYKKNISLELIKLIKPIFESYDARRKGYIYNNIISVGIPILEILEKYKLYENNTVHLRIENKDIVQLLYTFFYDLFIDIIKVLPEMPKTLHASFICNQFVGWFDVNKYPIDKDLIKIIFDKIASYYKHNEDIDSMPFKFY